MIDIVRNKFKEAANRYRYTFEIEGEHDRDMENTRREFLSQMQLLGEVLKEYYASIRESKDQDKNQ